MDAMSEAVEGAEVMLYGVSSLYKERYRMLGSLAYVRTSGDSN